jgi:hypothetical protein
MKMKRFPEIRKQCEERGLRDPLHAFIKQRSGAKERGIGFELTFEEWWNFWKDSYHLRGGGDDQLCMARNGDVGPYAIGNVSMLTNRQNALEYSKSQKLKDDAKARAADRWAEVLEYAAFVNAKHGPNLPYEAMMARRLAKSET